MTLTPEQRSEFRNLGPMVGGLALIEAIGGLIPARITKIGRRGVVEAVRRESKPVGISNSDGKVSEWVTTITFRKPKDSTWAAALYTSHELLDRTVDEIVSELPPRFERWEDARDRISEYLTPTGRELWWFPVFAVIGFYDSEDSGNSEDSGDSRVYCIEWISGDSIDNLSQQAVGLEAEILGVYVTQGQCERALEEDRARIEKRKEEKI